MRARRLARGNRNVEFEPVHPEGERGSSRVSRDQAAKAVCAVCPVLAECARHALAVREPYGVWGGMSEDEREAIYQRTKISMAV